MDSTKSTAHSASTEPTAGAPAAFTAAQCAESELPTAHERKRRAIHNGSPTNFTYKAKVNLSLCSIGDRLERPCYLSRVDLNRKIRSRKQKTDIGKYSFVNRTIQVWNQLPADVLGTLSCKPSNFRKRVRKVINKAKLKGDQRSEVN
jgi:hypothetical protein